MAEIIGYIGRAQTLTAELSTPQTLTASFGGGGTAHGIPAGGEPGQGLIKVSDADYDVKWMSILPEDTASGSVASFPDGADDLPMGVVVDIDPVQDLHGYDNPWPGGGGKNQLKPLSRIPFTQNGITISLVNGAYVFNGTATASFNLRLDSWGGTDGERAEIPHGDGILNMMWSVYAENVPSGQSQYIQGGYFLNGNASQTRVNFGGTQIISRTVTSTDVINTRSYINIANGVTYNNFTLKIQCEIGTTATSWTPYENICPISGRTKATISHSGADTSNPTEYEIPFSTEVYGGTLNVTTGELVVDRAMVTFDGSSDERWTVTNVKTAYTQLNALKRELNYSQSMKCNNLRLVNNHTNLNNTEYSITGYGDYAGNYPNQNWIYLKVTSAYDTIASIREWLTANPVTIVYTLATPITLTLDPVEIRSLLGDNNVWADTGNTTVTYLADVKKYIDKKISAAVAAMS